MTLVPYSLSKSSFMLAGADRLLGKTFSKHGGPSKVLARFSLTKDAKLLGSLGASKGGIERAKSLTVKERRTIAQNAAKARWK